MPRVLRNADCRRGLEAPADVLADPVRGVGVEAKSLAPVPALVERFDIEPFPDFSAK